MFWIQTIVLLTQRLTEKPYNHQLPHPHPQRPYDVSRNRCRYVTLPLIENYKLIQNLTLTLAYLSITLKPWQTTAWERSFGVYTSSIGMAAVRLLSTFVNFWSKIKFRKDRVLNKKPQRCCIYFKMYFCRVRE